MNKKAPAPRRPKCPHCGKFVDQEPERWLTVPEVAELLGINPQTVYKLTARRQIGFYKTGLGRSAKVLIPVSALEDYRRSLPYSPPL